MTLAMELVEDPTRPSRSESPPAEPGLRIRVEVTTFPVEATGHAAGWSPEGQDAIKATVAVAGELDVVSAPTLAATLRGVVNGGARLVVVDMAEVTFIDAAGLRVIGQAADHLGAAGGRLVLGQLSRMVTRLVRLAGLGHLRALEEAEDPATRSIAPPVEPATDPSSDSPWLAAPAASGPSSP